MIGDRDMLNEKEKIELYKKQERHYSKMAALYQSYAAGMRKEIKCEQKAMRARGFA